ncbi:MAG: thioesterase family protein [Polyangia bacterium]
MKATATASAASNSSLAVRVLYADTDQMGVVYHATYLRWFEAGRAHHMRRRGCTYASLESRGVMLPVVEAGLSYHAPARYDEVLDVSCTAGDIGRAQIRFEYEISRDGETLVTGFTRHAALGAGGRPTRLPHDVRGAIAGPENATGEQS